MDEPAPQPTEAEEFLADLLDVRTEQLHAASAEIARLRGLIRRANRALEQMSEKEEAPA